MSYFYGGHEAEGFFDIVTGRPRYPLEMYNPIRKQRVESRKVSFKGKKPFNITSYLLRPEGVSYQVPGLQEILKQAQKESRYSREGVY